MQTLAAFYGAFIVIALGSSLCGFFPLNVALIHWFERKRARALSAMSIGLAFGGIMVPLVAQSLTAFGWRPTAFASGIIAIVVGLPLALVIRNSPRELGEVVDGKRRDIARGNRNESNHGTRDFTAREALRTSAFWLISLGHGFALFVVHAVSVHAITHLKEGLGYSVASASLVISLVTALPDRRRAARLGDRRPLPQAPHRRGLHARPRARAAAPRPTRSTYRHGDRLRRPARRRVGLRGPFMQAIRADYFGRSAIGMILGLSFMIIVVGQVGGPVIPGIFADITGDYRLGFTIIGILAGLGSLFFIVARKPKRPLV